jgi:hypothetical protein
MRTATDKPKQLTIMVSSTVYGIEEVLEAAYDLLTNYGYEVWMSHKGSLPVFANRSAFENCLEGVRNCDIFLGIIGTSYGTGIDKDDPKSLSIVHLELREAITLDKPRWLLAHDNVITARTLLMKLGHAGPKARAKLNLKRSDVLEDLRLIDMYEEAIFDRLPLAERKGNWVQKFHDRKDASPYIMNQFRRYQEIAAYLEEHFKSGPPLKPQAQQP